MQKKEPTIADIDNNVENMKKKKKEWAVFSL